MSPMCPEYSVTYLTGRTAAGRTPIGEKSLDGFGDPVGTTDKPYSITPSLGSSPQVAPDRRLAEDRQRVQPAGAGGGMRLETKYALSGDISISYQVIGGGLIDIVYIPGFLSHLE
jgi:hypothetical protein